MNVVAILYYPSGFTNEIRLNHLKESLAKILPRFYTLAGRYIKENHLIDCSDQGAEYVEALVDCELLELVNGSKVNPDELNDLPPFETCAVDEVTDPLLAIQISKFKCSGLAIGVSISHRINDAASLAIFIEAWTNASRGENIETIFPIFNSPSLFPGRNFSLPDFEKTRKRDPTIVARRFIFNSGRSLKPER
ncbi:HXXXD-type acyl-transferase family protein [Forsythia ovata]|uniref:HXXXD-type acyl-transferase family protein n=1 Tax=Forsythia ovata TaxID=205694 RepID=A0ABD1UZM6_9LAMI